MKIKIEGIHVPVVTPLTDEREIDREGLTRLIDYVIAGGVDGVVVLGTTGEGPALGQEKKDEVVRSAKEAIKGRVKFLVGISGSAVEDMLALARGAAEEGADAVMVAPPYYFRLSQEELLRFTRHIARESPLPVLVYNIPQMVKAPFEPETLRHLMDEPNILGIKDSSKNGAYFREIAKCKSHRPDWSLMTGHEQLLKEAMEVGADGGVLAGANIYPRTLASYYQALVRKDAERCEKIHAELSERRQMYALGNSATSAIQVIKCGLEQLSICSRAMTFPFNGLDEDARNVVVRHLGLEAVN